MADLCIDFDALRRTRGNLADVENLLRGPCGGMAELPAEAAGHEVLRARLRDFADEWDYGIGRLGEFSAGVVDALASIETTFRQLDTELADAFTQDRTA